MAALQNAESLLDRLGATGKMAERLARYPLPPRLSRILVEAMERGVGEDGCVAAVLLGSGARSEKNELLAAMESQNDYRTVQHIEQLRRIARPPKQAKHDDDALLMSILAGFPDRVARRRAGNQVILSTGVSAEIAGEPSPYEFMVAIDAEDGNDNGLTLSEWVETCTLAGDGRDGKTVRGFVAALPESFETVTVQYPTDRFHTWNWKVSCGQPVQSRSRLCSWPKPCRRL